MSCSLRGTALELRTSINSFLEFFLAVGSDVDLLRLDDIVGSDILLLDISQVGLDAHRVIAQFAQESVTQGILFIRLVPFHFIEYIN